MPRIQAATVVEHRARQRRAILDAAREILAEGGSRAPSLAAVAQRTGLARPSVYQYFKSRDDLLEAVIADVFPSWSEYVTTQMKRADSDADRVLAYVEANLRLVAMGEHAIVRGLAASASSESIAESSRVLHEQLRTPLIEALTACRAVDAGAMAELIQAVVYAASRMIENGLPEQETQNLTRALLEPYLRNSSGSAASS